MSTDKKESLPNRIRKSVANAIYHQKQTDVPFANRRVTTVDPNAERTAASSLSYMRGWKGIMRLDYLFGNAVDIVELLKLALTPTPNMCINRISTDVSTTQ